MTTSNIIYTDFQMGCRLDPEAADQRLLFLDGVLQKLHQDELILLKQISERDNVIARMCEEKLKLRKALWAIQDAKKESKRMQREAEREIDREEA